MNLRFLKRIVDTEDDPTTSKKRRLLRMLKDKFRISGRLSDILFIVGSPSKKDPYNTPWIGIGIEGEVATLYFNKLDSIAKTEVGKAKILAKEYINKVGFKEGGYKYK